MSHKCCLVQSSLACMCLLACVCLKCSVSSGGKMDDWKGVFVDPSLPLQQIWVSKFKLQVCKQGGCSWKKKKTLNLPDKNLCHSKSEERNRVKRSYNNNNNSNSWWVWEVESHVILQFPIRATCTSGGTSAVAQGVGWRDCRVSPLIWKDWIEFVIWFNAYTAITIYKGVLVKSSHPNSNPSEQRTWKS